MKYLLLSIFLSSVLAGCTLGPRSSGRRPLSPDNEAAMPDRLPVDTVLTDSTASPIAP